MNAKSIFLKFAVILTMQIGSQICSKELAAQEKAIAAQTQKVLVNWKNSKPAGSVEVKFGHVSGIKIVKGRGKIRGVNFEFSSQGDASLLIELNNVQNKIGPEATVVTVKNIRNPFSFFLRDVTTAYPMYIPEYAVVVLNDTDKRSYADVEESMVSRKLKTKLQQLESEPEESFESASAHTTDHAVPTWLGLSRDFRIFQVVESVPHLPREGNQISPRFSSSPVIIPQLGNRPVTYSYNIGRGVGVQVNTHRRLEDGILPILHSTSVDEDITYQCTYFVGLEKSALTEKSLKGTNYLVADYYSGGNMLSAKQQDEVKSKADQFLNGAEQTVMYFRAEAVNTAKVPRYAWFKTARPGISWADKSGSAFDPENGFNTFSGDSVYCISKINGLPLSNPEMAVLLQPGEKAVFEFYIPHTPITRSRASDLSKVLFDTRLSECKQFWQKKLNAGASVRLPEKRIEEMYAAGLLHLDLINYGEEPSGTLNPAIGVYTAIGTESSPIMQTFASAGWQDVARRSLTYFLDKQHDNGFMQNFAGYMVETGAALWSIGEYYRYYRDKEWIENIQQKVLKSCDYLLRWRQQNRADSLRGRGYGMISGKVADPEDHFHQFMLNGYSYIGISRVAEMLKEINPKESERLAKEALSWKKDIRESFFQAMAYSPVVPSGDGSWIPTVPPWTEMTGPRSLFVNKELFFSHGTFTISDVILGPLYVAFCEALDVNEPAAKRMLDYHTELFFQHNAAFSQPYYSRHNWVQAKRGMVKPFLKTYYNTFSAISDRETYTFWEHLYQLTPHKTHEEGWFLMETRWMLYLEEDSTLRLLNTIPRKWMEEGKTIVLNNVQSYFGRLQLNVQSSVKQGLIEAVIRIDPARAPKTVTIRLPHPEGKKATKVTGGRYDPVTETIIIERFNGEASVGAEY